jgi:hypothetical protein
MAIQGVESRLHKLGLFWKPTKPRLPVPYELSMNRIWKGRAPQTVRVFSGFGATDCGALQVGKSYLVYATRDATGDYFTHACTRTRELALAAADLGQLGPGIGVRSSPQPARPATALLVALALLLAAGGAVLWRRWRVT